jgi:glucose 1-dehydrogenase
MTTSLNSQVAVITGGLGGIGSAIALELARRGADIAVCDLSTQNAEPLLSAVRAINRRGRCDQVDVTDASAVRAWLATVTDDLGMATLIVANAATANAPALGVLEPQDWRRDLAVNLDGALYVAMYAARALVAVRRTGRIVFVGSWAATQVHPAIPAYCVSKAAVRMLMRCMATEYAPYGILVNEVAPGYVNSGLGAVGVEEEQILSRQIPVGKLASAQDVALQVAWLCDPGNEHVTGTTVLMDGGLSLIGRPP